MIGEHPGRSALIGLALGVAFILLHYLVPSITIGFPTLPQATEGERLFITGGLAPIGEELAFRGLLMSAVDVVAPAYVSIPAQAAAFALFHVKAYAGSFTKQGIQSASGAFFGAGIFGLISGVVTVWTKSLIPGIIMHAAFNIWLLATVLVIVGAIIMIRNYQTRTEEVLSI